MEQTVITIRPASITVKNGSQDRTYHVDKDIGSFVVISNPDFKVQHSGSSGSYGNLFLNSHVAIAGRSANLVYVRPPSASKSARRCLLIDSHAPETASHYIGWNVEALYECLELNVTDVKTNGIGWLHEGVAMSILEVNGTRQRAVRTVSHFIDVFPALMLALKHKQAIFRNPFNFSDFVQIASQSGADGLAALRASTVVASFDKNNWYTGARLNSVTETPTRFDYHSEQIIASMLQSCKMAVKAPYVRPQSYVLENGWDKHPLTGIMLTNYGKSMVNQFKPSCLINKLGAL